MDSDVENAYRRPHSNGVLLQTEMNKQRRRNPSPKGDTTPILVYATIIVGGILGYIIGEGVWIRQVHFLHYIPILPLGFIGYLIGKWIYRLRGYQDII